MKTAFLFLALAITGQSEEKQIFNGKDLTGWSGAPEFWSVEDGAITAKATAENPVPHNTFLIWKDGEVSDFILTFKYKMTPGDDKKFTNSGVQYRSRVLDPEKFIVGGYQADFEYGDTYSGILYEEKGRGILARRGQVATITQSGDPKKPDIEVTGETGKNRGNPGRHQQG